MHLYCIQIRKKTEKTFIVTLSLRICQNMQTKFSTFFLIKCFSMLHQCLRVYSPFVPFITCHITPFIHAKMLLLLVNSPIVISPERNYVLQKYCRIDNSPSGNWAADYFAARNGRVFLCTGKESIKILCTGKSIKAHW